MNPNQGHTIRNGLIGLIAVVVVLVFASLVQAKEGDDQGNTTTNGTNSTTSTNSADQKPQEPKSVLPATQKDVDAFAQLQDIATQRQAVLSNNVLAHQAKVNWENEQIYVALREVLSYTVPGMVADLDQWWNVNLGHPKLPNAELQGLDGKQIDLATAKDPNWKKLLEKQNALFLEQKKTADLQFSSHNYEIMWLECYRQFLTRLAEVLRPQPTAATSYYDGGYSGGGGEAAAIQDPTKPADVNTPYNQNWGYDSVPEVINQNGGAEQNVDDAFRGMNIE